MVEHTATALGAATVALGLAACAGTGSTVATAQSPQCDNGMLCGDPVDKDKDGQITASEWSSTFQGMDTNGDGVVSQSEFRPQPGASGVAVAAVAGDRGPTGLRHLPAPPPGRPARHCRDDRPAVGPTERRRHLSKSAERDRRRGAIVPRHWPSLWRRSAPAWGSAARRRAPPGRRPPPPRRPARSWPPSGGGRHSSSRTSTATAASACPSWRARWPGGSPRWTPSQTTR